MFESFVAHGSWRFLLERLRIDAVHPPLQYVVVKAVESFHPSEAARKIPDAIWGAGAVGGAGWLLRRRAGPAVALPAMALFALSPVHVRLSQELRPYSLGIFLLLASLAALELRLERRTPARSVLLFSLVLATAYTLTLAAVVLAVAGASLVVEDSIAPRPDDPERRLSARRLAREAPLFALALAAAYSPWLPVFLRGVRSLSREPGKKLTLSSGAHLLSGLTLSYKPGGFSFGPPALYAGVFALYVALALLGAAACLRRPGLRFLPAWAAIGLLAIEVLRQRSPSHFGARYSLAAGIAIPLLAGAGVATLFSRRWLHFPAAAALGVLLAFEAASLGLYFVEGRADWRPLARFLARTPDRPIFTDNENSRMCLAYYLCGPQWLADGERCGTRLVDLSGSVGPLEASLASGHPSWLVLSGMPTSRAPRAWSARFPSISFPEAESVTLVRIGGQAPAERNHSAVFRIPSRSGM